MLVQFLPQRGAVHAELPRGGGALALVILQRNVQQRRLDDSEKMFINLTVSSASSACSSAHFRAAATTAASDIGHGTIDRCDRHRRRQVLRHDRPAASHDQRMVDRIAQLANIAVPWPALQFGECFRRDRHLRRAGRIGKRRGEILGQLGDVSGRSRSGGRWMQNAHSRKYKSWRNEPSSTRLCQIAMRRRYDAEISLHRLVATDRNHFAVFQRA